MKEKSAELRFYEELNDFLVPEHRKVAFRFAFSGNPSIKDVVESQGVPHVEVDLILANGVSIDFSYQLQAGDHISVYPVFESLDISPVTHLRDKPLRRTRFILDVHLGQLARYLRMLGFDTLYENNYADEQIIKIAIEKKRIILTRDVGLLKNGRVTHGYWMRHTDPKKQVQEVFQRFNLQKAIKPFVRCLECNGELVAVDKTEVVDQLPPKTKDYYQDFYHCTSCKKVYWEGSHYQKMLALVKAFSR